jgi:hypothetical protein
VCVGGWVGGWARVCVYGHVGARNTHTHTLEVWPMALAVVKPACAVCARPPSASVSRDSPTPWHIHTYTPTDTEAHAGTYGGAGGDAANLGVHGSKLVLLRAQPYELLGQNLRRLSLPRLRRLLDVGQLHVRVRVRLQRRAQRQRQKEGEGGGYGHTRPSGARRKEATWRQLVPASARCARARHARASGRVACPTTLAWTPAAALS